MRGGDDFFMPWKHIPPHGFGAQHGLGLKSPVVIGHQCANGRVLHSYGVILGQAAAYGGKDILRQFFIVIHHHAEVFIADQCDDVLQHAAWSADDQLHAPA